MLRKFVFIHLEQPADKLQLLLAMMHKLYAMITRQCSDDNPDALIHHEVLGPRHAPLQSVHLSSDISNVHSAQLCSMQPSVMANMLTFCHGAHGSVYNWHVQRHEHNCPMAEADHVSVHEGCTGKLHNFH